jgi:tetratricopeptide (TPR) repeat protein
VGQGGHLSASSRSKGRQTDHPTEARRFAERAQAIAEELGDLSLEVAANLYLRQAYFLSGEYRLAENFLRKNVQLLQGDRTRELMGLAGLPSVMSGSYLAWSLAERGEFHEGLIHGEGGISLAEAVNHQYSLILGSWRLAALYCVKGELTHAACLLERALAIAREMNVGLLSPYVMGSLGYVYALCGRVTEGLSLLQQALKAFESMRLFAFYSLIMVYLSEACLLADRLGDAAAAAGRAFTFAREHDERGHEAYALRLLGEIASHTDPPAVETAEDHYHQAIARADNLGMRPLVAHCHLGLGRLYRRTDKREQAQEHFTTATTMYRDMGMTYWLEKAEAEVRELR